MRKKLVIFMMILVSLLFTACGSAQKKAEEQAKMAQDIEGYKLPVMPTDSTAVVYVVRPSNFAFAIAFDLSINEMYTKLGAKSVAAFIVKPGDYTLLLKSENKKEIPFKAEAGQVYFYHVNAKMGWLYARVNGKSIDGVEGTYYVKHFYEEGKSPIVDVSKAKKDAKKDAKEEVKEDAEEEVKEDTEEE